MGLSPANLPLLILKPTSCERGSRSQCSYRPLVPSSPWQTKRTRPWLELYSLRPRPAVSSTAATSMTLILSVSGAPWYTLSATVAAAVLFWSSLSRRAGREGQITTNSIILYQAYSQAYSQLSLAIL